MLSCATWNCSKSDQTDTRVVAREGVIERNEEAGHHYIYAYFLDEIPTSEFEIDTTANNWIVSIAKPIPNSSGILIEIYKFSTKTAYIQFGRERNLCIQKCLEIGEHLYYVADSAGVIAQYESTGTVPAWYTDYCNTYFANSRFSGGANDRSPYVMLHKSCPGETQNWPMATTYPIMPPGWNDAAFGFTPIGIGSVVAIWDRTFYRRHLGTAFAFGMSKTCFPPALDDRMSSGFAM